MIIKRIQGLTLLEVLISTLLFSIMLFALGAMQLTAMRESESAYFFMLATVQVNNMEERLKALGDFSGLEKEQDHWNEENRQLLPRAVGRIEGRYPIYTLQLSWGRAEETC